jgi:hypothetical protein
MMRHGLATIAWCLGLALALALAVPRLGLGHIQSVVWPADIHAFSQLPGGDVDVAILGSSRASFGLSPSALDRCLGEGLGRPTRTVNLARTFTTGFGAHRTWQTALAGDKRPRVLVLAVGPEFFDERNPQLPASLGQLATLGDLPQTLARVRSLDDLSGALRPLVRGIEVLPIALAHRDDEEAWLRWMMLHHGGGQFCFEDGDAQEGCRTNNRSVQTQLRNRWQTAVVDQLPGLAEVRYGDHTLGGGMVEAHTEALLAEARAADVPVLFVKLPLHRTWLDHTPDAVESAWSTHMERLGQREGVALHDAHTRRWITKRSLFIDPDHLGPKGSEALSDEVCRQSLLPLLAAQEG